MLLSWSKRRYCTEYLTTIPRLLVDECKSYLRDWGLCRISLLAIYQQNNTRTGTWLGKLESISIGNFVRFHAELGIGVLRKTKIQTKAQTNTFVAPVDFGVVACAMYTLHLPFGCLSVRLNSFRCKRKISTHNAYSKYKHMQVLQ